MNDIYLSTIASNKLRGYAIMLGEVYVCDDAHDEITEKIFSRKELNDNKLI